ncbi:MAG: hypothetical protein OD817_04770 [Gammaproteobacteria bacterium]
MTDYYDLGAHTRAVSTDSAEAQRWFDRGLMWCYGYNHDESVKCFEKALQADPKCAMAHWGVAYASGPNYNKPWETFDPVDLKRSLARAHAAAQQAAALAGRASPAERALIEAVAHRYPSAKPAKDCSAWNLPYAEAMRKVRRAHADDPDVAALCAEALMNIKPWGLWDLKSGAPVEEACTEEIKALLEEALARAGGENHPGLLHMYIHLMEMSPFPERALKACDRLRNLAPDAGHLQHMPTHIDVLCGHYSDVVKWNHRAVEADRKYLAREGPLNFYSLYRCHNQHFKLYGAMFLGQCGPALEAAEEMAASLPEELLRQEVPPMADWLEGFVPMKMHVLIRFGMWEEILAQPLPADGALFSMTTAVIRYARAVAFAASGRAAEAMREAPLFEAARAAVQPTRYIFNNSCADILAVAAEMLKGELAYRKGEHDAAFAHLRRSVELDDNLPYDEPWSWMQPARHALGALLLEQGRADEAEQIYRADLGLDATLSRACQHPDNVWSLHGYHECLQKLGRDAEAHIIEQRLTLAQARADSPVKASCFCRTQHSA